MKTQFIIALSILIMATACKSQKNKTPDKWSETELNEWFSKGEWKEGWDVRPDEEDVLFEAHRKYADIQVVISGEEKIRILPLDSTTVVIPYEEEKDIVFLTADAENYRIAEPGKLFLFFPDNAH